MKHIDFTKLIEKYEGLLSKSVESEILNHLLICNECNIQANKIEAFFDYRKSFEIEDVPQNITANLLNIFRPKKQKAEQKSFVKRILANLVFDDWQMALNERLAFTDTRQMLYRVQDIDIDLRFYFIDGKCQVSGQVFPNIKSQGIVEIISQTDKKQSTLNNYSEFIFPLISQGVYDIHINLDQTFIEIPKLSLLH